MTGADTPDDERNDRNDRNDRHDANGADEHWLSTLLSALTSLESGERDEHRTSGRRRGDRSVIDYDISIRSGDDLSEDDPRPGPTPFTRDESGDRNDDSDRRNRRTRRYRSSPTSSEHRVDVREYDDEFLVTADVGGIDPEEVTVGFDDSTLVIGVSDRELDRVAVPWAADERTSRATIKNGVLTVRIVPESAAEPEPEDASEDDHE